MAEKTEPSAVSIQGAALCADRGWQPGVPSQGGVEWRPWADAVVAAGGQVGADAAVPGEGGQGMPICQYPETAWCRLGSLIACSEALLVQARRSCW
jgi:hypothetical protein